MQVTLTQAVERCLLDLERFLEVWPLLTSRDLLQALEALSGKTVSLYVAAPAGGDARVELLVDCDAARAAIDAGSGARWGSWKTEAAGARLTLEDGSGDWQLAGLTAGASLSLVPRS
jgi:hypothetical protein